MINYLLLIILGLVLATSANAKDKFDIFACEPEWASLAKEIGGDKIDVFTATNAYQDPHHVRAKPSLMVAMRKAEMVVCSGASLEVGWLPVLQEKVGSAGTMPGSDGYLLAANYVPMLERPLRLDRADGDIHPEGNPHVQLNPHNIALVASELTKRLKMLDSSNADFYQANYDSFSKRWNNSIKRWEDEAARLRGMDVVVHHKSFSYLLDWLGMNEVGSLELKPGLPPTTSHLEGLLKVLKAHPAKMIIHSPYESEDASMWLSEKTGTKVVTLPFTVGGNNQSGDLFSMFDSTIQLLNEAGNAK